MKVNFVYSDLNPCGGAEKLSLISMQSLIELGINIDLTTLESPDPKRIENAFGKDLSSVLLHINDIHILDAIDENNIERNIQHDYRLVFNSHGDIDPYYHKSRNRLNTITYCHFPTAKFLIESKNEEYFDRYLKISRFEGVCNSGSNFNSLPLSSSQISVVPFDKLKYLHWVKQIYENMLRNSTLVTNSKYSRNEISQVLGITDSLVIHPPVDVDKFRNMSLYPAISKGIKENNIVTVCRIDPAKKIENVILLARKLRKSEANLKITIVGNLDPYYYQYYCDLKQMISEHNLEGNVSFKLNASLESLINTISESGIIFHPKPGEHFGISIVEAMSAGLVPVVPSIGGATEFVPFKYQYDCIETAVKIILSSLQTTDDERIRISNSVSQFSTNSYKTKIKNLTTRLLNKMEYTSF